MSGDKKVSENKKKPDEAVAKGFQDLPPEIIGKIMSYCSTADQKEMRCVSKWYLNVVSTASEKLKSLFETYTIKNVNESNYSQISEVLSNAIKRSFGPEVRLDLQLNKSFNRALSSEQMREILTSYKKNIVSLNILLMNDPEILLQPHLEFTNIQKLDISFHGVDYGLHKNIHEGILARYGDKLEHLGVKFLKVPNKTALQLPHLSKLKSIALNDVDNYIVHTFLNAVNKENSISKLQHLELMNTSGESALELIKCNKDSITKLKLSDVNFTQSDIGDIKILNLQYLILCGIPGDVALSLIKCNKDSITNLKVHNVYFRNSDIGDIKIPNLQYLILCGIPGDVALSLIKCNKDTVTNLKVHNVNFRQSDNGYVMIPNLQSLGFWKISSNIAISLIKCNKDTITKLKVNNVNFMPSDIGDIKIPNLSNLEISYISVDNALSLIKNNKESLYEIRLNIYEFGNTSLPVVKMPRLKRLYLQVFGDTSKLKLIKIIKAFGGNIEDFWSYDSNKQTYIRTSREELNNLKLKAFALQ